ncbi:hypothetical protein PHLH3_10030 [Pseudomonas sp. St386]|jgi:hypothetical protein|nr:hypothetical protein LRP86_03125 [Pseudomonas brassicacearum]BBP51377.1 hypothetical protein PHLH3_10030 [Pseudomonas sp. St386]SDP99423.1 hypothetical protein SAMN04490180_5623 [Pseudomonas brassicacearum]
MNHLNDYTNQDEALNKKTWRWRPKNGETA